MSIDKDSDGLPGLNGHRSTIKVNLWMVVGIVLFLAATAVIAFQFARRNPAPAAMPPSAAEPR